MPFSDCNLFILIASIAHCCELHKTKNKTKDCREKARERERKKLSFIVFMFHGITQSKINILIYCYNSCRKVCLVCMFSFRKFAEEIFSHNFVLAQLFSYWYIRLLLAVRFGVVYGLTNIHPETYFLFIIWHLLTKYLLAHLLFLAKCFMTTNLHEHRIRRAKFFVEISTSEKENEALFFGKVWWNK